MVQLTNESAMFHSVFVGGTQVLAPANNLMQNAGGALSSIQQIVPAAVGSGQTTSPSGIQSQPLTALASNALQNGKLYLEFSSANLMLNRIKCRTKCEQ